MLRQPPGTVDVVRQVALKLKNATELQATNGDFTPENPVTESSQFVWLPLVESETHSWIRDRCESAGTLNAEEAPLNARPRRVTPFQNDTSGAGLEAESLFVSAFGFCVCLVPNGS